MIFDSCVSVKRTEMEKKGDSWGGGGGGSNIPVSSGMVEKRNNRGWKI